MFWRKKLYYIIVVAILFLSQGSLFSADNEVYEQNFSFVQPDDPGRPGIVHLNPQFNEGLFSDLHYLIARSYKATKRDSARHYINQHMLEKDENVQVYSTGHHWRCIRNFQGEQGNFVTTNFAWRVVRWMIRAFADGHLPHEVDYPGFIAYSTDADPSGSIIWVAVVLRGSQGEEFQPANGMFGGSWVTNYNAGPAILNKKFFPFDGYAHSGYLNKILSCNISMRNAINQALTEIGRENFPRIRFIVTGHSQGGGLAQIALPLIIHEYGYIYDDQFKNTKTPRFFGYFMSTPRAISGKDTAKSYLDYVGEDNVIRHQVYGDVVPMLCLPGYMPVGHLAIDTFYDAICRAIRSETAYCNRYMLFYSIKDLIDPSKFILDKENDAWISAANPNFELNWTELCKIVCSQSALHDLSSETLFRPFLKSAFRAAHPTKIFEDTRELPEVSDEFLLSLLKPQYDLSYVENILRDFSFFDDIVLEERKKERIFMISDEFEKKFGNFEKTGIMGALNNCSSLNDISTTLNKFDDFEKFVNQDLEKILPHDGIIVNNKITPTGDTSAIAYVHYGSASNYFKSKLFDNNVPSKKLNAALRNGYELTRSKQDNNERCLFLYQESLPKVLFNLLEKE